MKGKKKGDMSKGEDTQRSHTPSSAPEESDPTKRRPEPGTGGLSKRKYREATEEAVEDIHG